jgi:hypothetical protein
MADGCKQRDVVADLKNEILVYGALSADASRAHGPATGPCQPRRPTSPRFAADMPCALLDHRVAGVVFALGAASPVRFPWGRAAS